MDNELLYNEFYERTADFGRAQFVKLLMEKERDNKQLKKQLEYIRSGEYYNQLRFERDMLQKVVDNGEVSKDDKEFIDCTHRNTELLEEKQEVIDYLKEEQNRLVRETSAVYEDGLGKRKLVNEEIYNEVSKILSRIEKSDK